MKLAALTGLRSTVLASVMSIAMVGCSSISGLTGSDQYACQAPAGVKCDSVSGTYYNALRNNLPSQRPQSGPTGAADSHRAAEAVGVGAPASVRAATAPLAFASHVGEGVAGSAPIAPPLLRAQARIVRLWFKPWEDADRDLYDQGYIYVQVDSGRWLVEQAQRRIRDAFAPVRPPREQANTEPSDVGNEASAPGAVGKDDLRRAMEAVSTLEARTRMNAAVNASPGAR